MSQPHSHPEDRGSTTYLVAVCLVAALGGLLFGYDTGVISGAIGSMKAHFNLTSGEEGWAGSCVLVGCMIGVVIAGLVSDFLGRRRTMLLAGFLFLISSIGTAVPQTLSVFVLFRMLAGVGVGFASMASPMYIAEISPARLRGRMVSINQFAIISGMLIVYFVNYFIIRQGDDEWKIAMSWRWMFASGAVPSLLFLLLLLAVPESPRWLVDRGRLREANNVLWRISGKHGAQAELAAIEGAAAGKTFIESLHELFRPGLRFALVLGVLLAILQQVTGINVFLYFAPKIFKAIGGADEKAALLQQVVVGAVNLLFTIVAIWTVDRVGRKPLMVIGALGMGACLLAMGAAAYFQIETAAWMLVFILGYIACFALSVGPVTWVILSEIFPSGVRGCALAIATFFLWMADWGVTQTYPMMEDEKGYLVANFHHAFPFAIYAVFCLILLIVLRWVPETKGKSLEEIEASWKAGRRGAVPEPTGQAAER
jgi:SP family xylose:H+ symportor-like MFS transporter